MNHGADSFCKTNASRRPEFIKSESEPILHAETHAETLLSNLGLFFVPAGVGVVALASILSAQIWALGAVLILSAIITLMLTVWAFILVRKLISVRRRS